MAEGTKSVVIAYVLWFFGGVFGIHHFYLRRDRQAFVWWATWGGFCGIGWLRDLCYIPQYVGLANYDREYIDRAKSEEERSPTPPFSTSRFFAEIAFGWLIGFLAQYAIPSELLEGETPLSYCLLMIGPFGTGLGVYVVASIGREYCSWKIPLISSYVVAPLVFFEPMNLFYCGIVSAVATSWKGARWRPAGLSRSRPRKHVCKRLSILTVCGIVYLSLWGSMIYFNASITTKEGDEVKVREALNNFFKSPAWLEMKEIFWQLYQNIQTVGWQKFFEDLIQAIDPQGEGNALKVLELEPDATQEQITARYRKLAKQWHPDRHKDPAKKKAAQEKFIEIQQAYERLSDIKAKRTERAKHSQTESP